MAVVYRTQRRVEFSDTDMAGIVHFARFFLWMEHVEQEFLRSLGLSVSMVYEGVPMGFPRVSARCDYVSTVTFEDVMDIEIEIEKIGTKSISYLFHFMKAGKTVARGNLVACCCRKNAERKMEGIPIPDSFRAKLASLMTQETT
ncbi:MAG: thioesterase family protein [Gemmatales bacterium]